LYTLETFYVVCVANVASSNLANTIERSVLGQQLQAALFNFAENRICFHFEREEHEEEVL